MLLGERPRQNKATDRKEDADAIATMAKQTKETVRIKHINRGRGRPRYCLVKVCPHCGAIKLVCVAVEQDNGSDCDEPQPIDLGYKGPAFRDPSK